MLKFQKIEGEVYFVSDTHYNHKNICLGVSSWDEQSKLKCRIFSSLEEMNETIIDSINKKVGENDILVLGGDVAFGGHQKIGEFFDSLNTTKIIWLQGNHDHNMHKYLDHPKVFMYGTVLNLEIEGVKMVLSHHPQFHWLNQEDGTWNLHGHLHGDEDEVLKLIHQYRSFDIGIDNYYNIYSQYGVFDIDQLKDIMETKKVIGRH